jgi:glycosyltransferase involved in cell wall biosynthesis
MRLLFVTPQLPWPATQGTTLRNFHLIQAAASQHEVDLLSFVPGAVVPSDAAVSSAGPLQAVCRRIEMVAAPPRLPWRRLADLAVGYADMERRLWSTTFDRTVRALIREGGYDAIQLEGFEVAGYLLGPSALRCEALDDGPPLPPLIFDDHNAEYELQASAARIDSHLPRRWPRATYSFIQARRLRRQEALYCAGADLTLAVSEEDAAALEKVVPGLGAIVVPNGVDVAGTPPAAPGLAPVIFFAGKLDYRPNVDACEWLVREILPRVSAAVLGVRVVLAGRDPAPAVSRLAGPAVEVTGALAERALAARRAAAWVYAVPMRMGSGVRFKALEAMAAGVPLVATTLGAAGSGAVHGQQALIADDAAAFAAALIHLLQQPVERQRLANAARQLAAERHDWQRITPRLLGVYEQLGQRRQRRANAAKVSAITTLLNERRSLGPLLASLRWQAQPPAEVVVADGGSTDGTRDLLAASDLGTAALRIVDAPGANISQGRNRAIAAAAHETIAATDGGVVLHPAWLARLVAPLERSPTLRAVGGFFVADAHSTWERALGATTLPAAGEIDPAAFLPSSRSVAFRRAAWGDAGGYPEWLDYGEDLVFDLAVKQHAGASDVAFRFQPRAVVRFRPRSSPEAFYWQYFRYARGDGKAGLWPRRHAIRYAAYVVGMGLLATLLDARHRPGARVAALAALAVGVGGYIRRPLVRLAHQSDTAGTFLRAAPLVPLVRLIGDVAKMLGYPVGVAWRRRYRRPGAPGA